MRHICITILRLSVKTRRKKKKKQQMMAEEIWWIFSMPLELQRTIISLRKIPRQSQDADCPSWYRVRQIASAVPASLTWKMALHQFSSESIWKTYQSGTWKIPWRAAMQTALHPVPSCGNLQFFIMRWGKKPFQKAQLYNKGGGGKIHTGPGMKQQKPRNMQRTWWKQMVI